jgi:NAD(P)-dependent dehydrogenase (short-subunit alcohol dehydrogenase family)
MAEPKKVVIVGGSQGLGLEIAGHYAGRGAEVVITGRDLAKAEKAAKALGPNARALAFDLAAPDGIRTSLTSVESLDALIMCAIQRDENTIKDFNIERATYLVMMKLVGYMETIHVLRPRFPADHGAIVLFGGQAFYRPYPSSLTVSTVNGGVSGMMHAMAVELAPIRVNAIHPGVVNDSPYWAPKTEALERLKTRTPGGRELHMSDMTSAVAFLLENEGANGIDLMVDNGRIWM